MKLLALIVLAIIAISTIDAKIQRYKSNSHKTHSSSHRHRRVLKRSLGENFRQFMLGVFTALGGDGSLSFLEECLNMDVSKLKGNAEESLDKNIDQGSQSTWDSILSNLGAGINVVCTIKDNIISFFWDQLKRYRRLRRRNRRLFLQGKKLRYLKRLRWSWSDLWNSVTGWVSSAADHIVSGVKAAVNAGVSLVVDGINYAIATAAEIATYIAKFIGEHIKPIGDFFASIKAKIVGFLNSEYVQGAMHIFQCIILFRDVIKNIVTTLKNFIYMLMSMVTPAGWIKLMVALICGWKHLKNAISAFKRAWNKSGGERWNNFGQGLGFMINAIGS